MHELGWFLCPNAFGATPRPAPAKFCRHSSVFGSHGSHSRVLQKLINFGPNTGRPPCLTKHGVASPYKSQGIWAFSCCPKPSCKWFPSCSTSLYSIRSCSCFKFIRKRKKIISTFSLPFAFVFPFNLAARTCFWWYYYPARTILWCGLTHKNDFVACYHPQGRFLCEATKPRKEY